MSSTGANVDQIKRNLDRDAVNAEDKIILDWIIHPVDYDAQHNDYIKRRQPKTGQWFLRSEEFKTWTYNVNKTLFCPGIPGAGKSIITSTVVDHLYSRFQNNSSIGIAFLYCQIIWQDKQTPEGLFESILKQLVQKQSPLPQEVKDLYMQHKARKPPPQLEELSQVLKTVISSYSQTFIIVDALDEYRDDNGSRSKFLNEIFSLQNETQLNLLATSRPQEVEAAFRNCISREICATKEDIGVYVDEQISQWEKKKNCPPDEKLRHEIKATVTAAAEEM